MRVLGEYKYLKPAVSPAPLLSLHEMRVVVGGGGRGAVGWGWGGRTEQKWSQTCRLGRAAFLVRVPWFLMQP